LLLLLDTAGLSAMRRDDIEVPRGAHLN